MYIVLENLLFSTSTAGEINGMDMIWYGYDSHEALYLNFEINDP